MNVTNPYAPSQSACASLGSPSFRRLRTYFDAALIGAGMSIIAPVCNTIYCGLVLDMPAFGTLRSLVITMAPAALACVLIGLILAVLVPPRVSLWLSRFQVKVPTIINASLFSAYFSLLGFGYVRGSISILGYTFTHYVLAPALTAGIGTFLHVIVRPWRDTLTTLHDG